MAVLLSWITHSYIPPSASVALTMLSVVALPDLVHFITVSGRVDVQESCRSPPFTTYCTGGALNTMLGSVEREREASLEFNVS